MGRPLNNANYHAINLVSYLTMITFNALANALPLNGMTTGEVSDRYPNLFTPARPFDRGLIDCHRARRSGD